MQPILTVGSVAFDSIRTPAGEASRVVGGAATYFSLAASLFAPVRLVAVVGDDFGPEQQQVFAGREIDLSGLERVAGETFRWRGEYGQNLNHRETIYTELNVFEAFRPRIPAAFRDTQLVFLANIHPELQLQVLDQVSSPALIAQDTMNIWIEGAPAALRRVLARVHVLIINDEEARQLSGEWNLVRAARAIRALGPERVVIKRGEHGVLMASGEHLFAAPAVPLETVCDPTGAGDTFAGGFMGHLAACGRVSDAALAQAVVAGSVAASFAVEEFGIERLLRLDRAQVAARCDAFQRLTGFEPL